MLKKLIPALLILLNSQSVKAQILPAEGNILNYRIIGFSYPKKDEVTNCKLEIAAGEFNNEDSFSNNIIKTINTTTSKILVEVPQFASKYTWRIVFGHRKIKSELHHFTTGSLPGITKSRLRITTHAKKHKDAYIFADNTRTMYDMSGNPVWYLPYKTIESNYNIVDLKSTSHGTITFIANDQLYETDYNGTILWKPSRNTFISGDSAEHYHHEFTRLHNGHYMALGCELLPCTQCLTDSNINENYKLTKKLPKIAFGTVIEYDINGNILWSWKSSKYYQESDLPNYNAHGSPLVDLHENAFYFNEKDNTLYLSFKHISRILKIKYPEGTVINSLGEQYKPNMPEMGNGSYCNQHSIKCAQNGDLYMYNNNACIDGLPSILRLNQPKPGETNIKITWQYECAAEGNRPKKFLTGGCVTELVSQDLLVCMGFDYGKIFIISKNKQTLWSALTETWNGPEQKWIPTGQYRASIIESGKDMEKLIWHQDSQNTTIHHNKTLTFHLANP